MKLKPIFYTIGFGQAFALQTARATVQLKEFAPDLRRLDDETEAEEGYEFEGDMELTVDQIFAMDDTMMHDAIIEPYQKWPKKNGVVEVPYVHSNKMSAQSQNNWDKAMAELASKTCVRFVPRKSEEKYVRVQFTHGCSSNVGMTTYNVLRIGDACAYGSFVHEMMHTLGMYHEQSRPDRDQYIDIDMSNVYGMYAGNFLKCKDCHTMNVPYEYGSVMHYGAYAFAKDRSKKTIITKNGASIGQRTHMTALDAESVNTLYDCPTSPNPRPTPRPRPDCSRLAGGGWTRVRHAPAGASKWHSATDHLAGTDEYGDPENDAAEWSTRFKGKNFEEFLFATGDCTKWLVAAKSSVYGNYENTPRLITKSSIIGAAHYMRWYNRPYATTDPWISLHDHSTAITYGTILYGAASYGQVQHTQVLAKNGGADVYIRIRERARDCQDMMDAGSSEEGEFMVYPFGDETAMKVWCRFDHGKARMSILVDEDNNYSKVAKERLPGHAGHMCSSSWRGDDYSEAGYTTFKELFLQRSAEGLFIDVDEFDIEGTFESEAHAWSATNGRKTYYKKNIPVGYAGDCYSWNACAAAKKGSFKIDLTGTGFAVDASVTWHGYGWGNGQDRMVNFKREQNGQVISANCGAWCGWCEPTGHIFLKPVAGYVPPSGAGRRLELAARRLEPSTIAGDAQSVLDDEEERTPSDRS